MIEPEAALWAPPGLNKDNEPDALETLRAVPLFEHLRTIQLKKILRIMHERTYQAGEVIFREGDPGAGMFIIRHGAVNIVIRMPDGAEKVIAEMTDRQFFGEMALLEDVPRSATAVATQKTRLLGFFEPDLESLLERDAAVGSRVCWNLAKLMANRLRAMNETLKAQRQLTPAERTR